MTAAVPSALMILLQLEQEVRHAGTPEIFRYTLVNRTRLLLPYAQAVLLSWSMDAAPKVVAVSDVTAPEADAPFVRWLGTAARQILAGDQGREVHQVEPTIADWAEWAPAAVLWVPLLRPDGKPMGALWLARDERWSDEQVVLALRLADSFGHAWAALEGGAPRRKLPDWVKDRRKHAWAAVAVLLLLMMPVRQSALAPAQVVAADPFIVAAPLDAVVARFHVRPNQPVAEGDPLVSFDDTDLSNRRKVAVEELAVAQAEQRKAEQGAFSDPQAAAQMALATAQVQLKLAELRQASDLLDRVTVKAPRAGIAVFGSTNDWIGRPVKTGERILLLADPSKVEIEAHLPVADAIALQSGGGVSLFLDAAPLDSLVGTVIEASYEATLLEEGLLAYRVRASVETMQPPRIGLRGTARIAGLRTPLFVFLFRRPIAAVRHWVGI